MCNQKNPLIESNQIDTIENLKEFIDFVVVSASNDEDIPAGMVLSLRMLREGIALLSDTSEEK